MYLRMLTLYKNVQMKGNKNQNTIDELRDKTKVNKNRNGVYLTELYPCMVYQRQRFIILGSNFYAAFFLVTCQSVYN